MKVIGIRNSPTAIRYCVLEKNGNDIVFVNQATENKIDIPKSLTTEFEKYSWIKSEFERVFDNQGPFSHVAIKQNENTPSRYTTLKPVIFIDCIATMVSIDKNIPFSFFNYNALGANSKESVTVAEGGVGRTNKHWDSKIADAILAAHKII